MPTSVLWLNSTLAKMPNDSAAPGQGAKISLRKRSARVLDGPRPPPSADGTSEENQASSCAVSMKPATVPTSSAERRDQDMPTRRAHRGRQLVAEECAQPSERTDARTVDRQERPQRKVFQIEQQIAVERDGARHRQRRERGAVEDRQPLQLVERERAHAAPLDPGDQAFELAPAVLAALAELAALEHELGLARVWRRPRRSAEPASS